MNYTSEQIFFQWVFKILIWVFAKAYGLDKSNIGEIKVNYIVKDDNPDVGFSVELGQVSDAEGQPIEGAQLSVEIASSDENVMAVTTNEDGKSGTVHFGAPGVAAFTVQVKGPDGTVLGSGGDNFTVTTGDPAAISGVTTSFDGLTPVEDTPAPEPTPEG